MNIDPYYSCFPKRGVLPCESHYSKGKYRTEEKRLLRIWLCFLLSVTETSLKLFLPLIMISL